MAFSGFAKFVRGISSTGVKSVKWRGDGENGRLRSPFWHFSEVALGEDVTAAGLEIDLECASQLFRLKGDIGFHFPRSEFCRMWNASGVMYS